MYMYVHVSTWFQLVPPARSYHCRLCNKCFAGMDHHCLFMYGCVARNNHRLFVIFILFTCLLMFLFAYFAYVYLALLHSDQPTFSDVLLVSWSACPATFFLMLGNAGSGTWLLTLIRFQLSVISRGMTTVWQPYRGATRLSQAQRVSNVVNFLRGRSLQAEPSSTKATIA